MGAARDAYQAALRYSLEREQFGAPLAAFQLTQQKLVEMVLEIEKGVLVALHTGRLKDAGRLRQEQISFGKLNNVRQAITVCRNARTVLGANGVTLDHSAARRGAACWNDPLAHSLIGPGPSGSGSGRRRRGAAAGCCRSPRPAGRPNRRP